MAAESRLILVDSSAWIAYLSAGASDTKEELEKLLSDPRDLATTGLIVCEVLQGVRDESRRRTIQGSLLALLLLAEPSVRTYLKAAAIYRLARRKGLTIRSTIDCVLAAQCLESRASILHRDRDFKAIATIVPLQIHEH